MSGKFTIREIEAFAARFYQGKQLLITPYGYNVTFAALAQGTNQQAVINIAANADFMLLNINQRAQIGAAQNIGNITAPFVRMLVTDSGSNEQYTAQAVDLMNFTGCQNDQLDLTYPRLISGRSTLNISVTNYAPTAETYTTLDLFFEGVLIRAYAQ